MYPLDDIDTNPISLDEFGASAIKDICGFVDNIRGLSSLANKQLTQFEWYMTFGYWCEYLNYFDELNKEMGRK